MCMGGGEGKEGGREANEMDGNSGTKRRKEGTEVAWPRVCL